MFTIATIKLLNSILLITVFYYLTVAVVSGPNFFLKTKTSRA
jgi:hypothetical protein